MEDADDKMKADGGNRGLGLHLFIREGDNRDGRPHRACIIDIARYQSSPCSNAALPILTRLHKCYREANALQYYLK